MRQDYIVLDGRHYMQLYSNTGSTLCYCSANEEPQDVFYIMMCDHGNTYSRTIPSFLFSNRSVLCRSKNYALSFVMQDACV